MRTTTPLSSGKMPALTWGKEDTIRSTADNAALAKLLCVKRGYYNDLYLRAMSVGAGGLVCGGRNGGNRKRVAAAMRRTTSGDERRHGICHAATTAIIIVVIFVIVSPKTTSPGPS
jgi:hypothetical protein